MKDAGFSSDYFSYHKMIKPFKTTNSEKSKGSELKDTNDEPKSYQV